MIYRDENISEEIFDGALDNMTETSMPTIEQLFREASNTQETKKYRFKCIEIASDVPVEEPWYRFEIMGRTYAVHSCYWGNYKDDSGRARVFTNLFHNYLKNSPCKTLEINVQMRE